MKITAVVVLCTLLLLSGPSSVGGDPPAIKPAAPPEDEFAGKVVMIWGKDPNNGGVLENVRCKQLGNRYFLVGKQAPKTDEKSRWTGVAVWIAIDQITRIAAFDSVDDAREAYAEL